MRESIDNSLLDSPECWPALPLEAWKDTYATLHMWTQIVGKVRLALTPLINQWWNVPLYVCARGLTTSSIPSDKRAFEVQFDFIDHKLALLTSDGAVRTLPLVSRSVAQFYQEFMELLASAHIDVKIWKMPREIPNPIPFDQDRVHATYQPEYAHRFWRILVSVDRVFTEFRSRFIGKSSPVHFFWGSFDLAVTRFSGRRAPERPGADAVTREAYSHEVSSVGFWPGSGDVKDAAFYSYAAPEPPGFREYTAQPEGAHYNPQLGEFILMYDDVRSAPSPSKALLGFCQSTYEAAAKLAHWDRQALEKSRTGTADAA
ncbi:MAG TPA: DUF5996 family protein [Terriglobales bacterium]|jgi:hypothetical protein|nr:DUF5996 family protein [Terriglobales bacterium]